MVLTHGAVLSGCIGIELICREGWSVVALATASEAPRAPGDTRRHQEPDCEVLSGQGREDSVAGHFTHTWIKSTNTEHALCATDF